MREGGVWIVYITLLVVFMFLRVMLQGSQRQALPYPLSSLAVKWSPIHTDMRTEPTELISKLEEESSQLPCGNTVPLIVSLVPSETLLQGNQIDCIRSDPLKMCEVKNMRYFKLSSVGNSVRYAVIKIECLSTSLHMNILIYFKYLHKYI